MTIVRVHPTRRRHRHFWNDLDRVFDPVSDDSVNESTGYEPTWHPSMDLTERKKDFALTIEIPGISEEDIDLSFEENVLTISGKKHSPSEERTKTFYSERAFGEFKRSIRFNTGVEANKISADYQNGVLTIILPKSKESMEREIPINFKK